MKISIIVPTYNEADNLGVLLPMIQESMRGYPYEVIFVDDRSPDGTWKIAQNFAKQYPNVKTIVRRKRQGLGSAIKRGFEACEGDLVVTMDADLSHDPRDIRGFIETMESTNAAVVVGSRFVEEGRIVGRGRIRNWISKVASKATNMLLGLKTRDVTSGFRLYRKDILQKILPKTKCMKFDFQLEVLSKIQEKVVEVPIIFKGKKRVRKPKTTSHEAPILSRIRSKIVGVPHKVVEVPIVFRDRVGGKSKFTLSEISSFMRAAWGLFLERQGARFTRFCAVAFSGIFFHLGVFLFLEMFVSLSLERELATIWFGPILGSPHIVTPYDLLALLIALEVYPLYTFFGNELWTFRDMAGPGRLRRAIKFNVISLVGLGMTFLVFSLLTGFYGLNILIADIIGILFAVFWTFIVSLNWAWMSQKNL